MSIEYLSFIAKTLVSKANKKPKGLKQIANLTTIPVISMYI